jgi:hypothetical protein
MFSGSIFSISMYFILSPILVLGLDTLHLIPSFIYVTTYWLVISDLFAFLFICLFIYLVMTVLGFEVKHSTSLATHPAHLV